ncbi:MAG TPA: histidine--tRNA ligase [Chthoniobacterales bacterium]|jgi:histidyl-tRNA synthetase|nr:histidine--tRNA ligase [Chthoniobacterales bacterium]
MQRLPGFRDFYPEECAFRNYLFATWRKVARSFGFLEYDGPTLEPTELYKKKSGEELKTQLFRFVDKGERDVCLRPEMTPTLARLVAARERDFRKPLKWFSISPFFRFEKPQKGRLREFYQINCDIIGDNSAAADAELIALGVALHEAFGLTSADFFVRLNNRALWAEFLSQNKKSPDQLWEFLAIVDKIGRESEEITARKLEVFGLNPGTVYEFLKTPADSLPGFGELVRELRWRGLEKFVELDLTIVRGLDYYTGLVFEFFDRKKENRSLAGGGRYDNLVSVISDGAVDLPAAGFAIGDVTLGNLLCELEHTKSRVDQALRNRLAAFIVVADESLRENAIQLANSLRQSGIPVDYALQPAKVGKQFQLAEALGAARTVVVGREWPQLRVKQLSDRTERIISKDEIHTIFPGV